MGVNCNEIKEPGLSSNQGEKRYKLVYFIMVPLRKKY